VSGVLVPQVKYHIGTSSRRPFPEAVVSCGPARHNSPRIHNRGRFGPPAHHSTCSSKSSAQESCEKQSKHLSLRSFETHLLARRSSQGGRSTMKYHHFRRRFAHRNEIENGSIGTDSERAGGRRRETVVFLSSPAGKVKLKWIKRRNAGRHDNNNRSLPDDGKEKNEKSERKKKKKKNGKAHRRKQNKH